MLRRIKTSIKKLLNPYQDQQMIKYVRDQLELISTVGSNFVDENGQFISFTNFKLSTDYYTEVAAGVMDREVTGSGDVKFEFEKPLRPHFRNCNFDSGSVLAVKGNAGAYFKPHYHVEQEIFRMATGEALIKTYAVEDSSLQITNTVKLKAGQLFKVRPMEIHDFHFITDALLSIELLPKLPGLIK